MSGAVNLFVDQGIATVEMADRASNNTFSQALLRGLVDVFQKIEKDETIKVVVIHGFDNYFCCGSTQEELYNFQAGKLTFIDLGIFRLLLDCPVPTISAMQGHAISGGLAFGCYADVIILAEECIYSTNFMKYGFTPGMGSTYIIPKKFGDTIGRELLYTAETYLGGVLKAKGVPLSVVRKADVIPHAMQIAKQLADKPQRALKLLKSQLNYSIREALPKVVAQELSMHEATFTQPEVKIRIEERFRQ
jgi:polyketide biosynthesis enoyl-CoA hydratase PksI